MGQLDDHAVEAAQDFLVCETHDAEERVGVEA